MALYQIKTIKKDKDFGLCLNNVWTELVYANLVKTLFFDGSVKGFDDFLYVMGKPNTLVHVLLKDTSLYGFFWLNNFNYRTAQIHFTAFYRSMGIRRNAPLWGRRCISYALCLKYKEEFTIDTVIGITPETNKLAVKYNERAGMTYVGTIPNRCFMYYENKSVPAVITYATRESLSLNGKLEYIWEE